MPVPIGQECKLYVNTATYAAPTWVEVAPIKDLSKPDGHNEVDVSDRGSKFNKSRKGLRKISFDFDMTYKPANEGFAKLKTAYETDGDAGHVDVLVLDGPVDDGGEGVRAFCEVLKFDHDEPLSDGVKVSTSLVPTYHLEGSTLIDPTVWPEPEGG